MQICNHVLRVPAGEQNIISGFDPERQRPLCHLVPPCHEKRNLIAAEAVFQDAPVVLEPTDRNCDVPPAASILPDCTEDLRRGSFTFDAGIIRLQQTNAAVRRRSRGRRIIEQVICKIRKRTLTLPQIDRFFTDLCSG